MNEAFLFTYFDLCHNFATKRVFLLFNGDFFNCWYFASSRLAFRQLTRTNTRLSLFDRVFVVLTHYKVAFNVTFRKTVQVRYRFVRHMCVVCFLIKSSRLFPISA